MMIATDTNTTTFHTSASLLINLRRWDDKRSWEEFYGLYREMVYGYARRSGLPHDEAEEATKDVFVRVALTLQEFDSNPGKGSFRAWLMNRTRRHVNDRLGSRAHAERHSLENRPPNGGGEIAPNMAGSVSRLMRWAGRKILVIGNTHELLW
jgi:RNA polymerase sigma factor (sigma-70 family)